MKKYHLRKRITQKNSEGGSKVAYEPAVEIEATIWPAGGKVQAEMYGERLQYMKNMELSLNRAYAVANYMTNTPYNKENGNKLRKMIVVEGASFSDPVLIDGKEDFSKSRRVELKLVMKKSDK